MRNSNLNGQRQFALVLIIVLVFVGGRLDGQDGNIETGSEPAKTTDAQSTEVQELNRQKHDAILIPMDQKGPIFVYDQSGGFRVAPPVDPVPDFQLFADGKLSVGGSSYGMPKLESTITHDELMSFLNLVVNENRFYELDEKAIEKKMTAGKEKVKLMDAATTRFAIDLQQGKKEVSVYALWNAAKNYPEIEELQRLAAIERRCKKMIYKVHLGEDGEMVLKAVNKAVAKLDQNIAPFKLEEIQNATRMTTGRFQVRFERPLAAGESAASSVTSPQMLHAIYFQKDANAEPTITFYGLPKK